MQVPVGFMCGVLSCCALWGRNYFVMNRTVDWLRAGMLRAEISRSAGRPAGGWRCCCDCAPGHVREHTPIPAMTSPWLPCVAALFLLPKDLTEVFPSSITVIGGRSNWLPSRGTYNLKRSGYVMNHQVSRREISRSAHTHTHTHTHTHAVFMCFVWIWEQTAIISLIKSQNALCGDHFQHCAHDLVSATKPFLDSWNSA